MLKLTILAIVIVGSIEAHAQGLDIISKGDGSVTYAPVIAKNPLTMTAEIGRYKPRENCKKEIDGCFPSVWISTKQFDVGERIWVKITVTNKSADLYASEWGTPDNYLFQVSVAADSGLPPDRTKRGCQLDPKACLSQTTEPPAPIELSGAGDYEVIAPGESWTVIEEVTEEFAVTTPGEYTVKLRAEGFNLTSKGNFDGFSYRDEKQIKRSGILTAEPMQFSITG